MASEIARPNSAGSQRPSLGIAAQRMGILRSSLPAQALHPSDVRPAMGPPPAIRGVRRDAATIQKEFQQFRREVTELLEQLPAETGERLRAALNEVRDFSQLHSLMDQLMEMLTGAGAKGSRLTSTEDTSSCLRGAVHWVKPLVFSLFAGVAMTAAWYAHTAIPRNRIAGPTTPGLVVHERKVGISWAMALAEYPFVILAARSAQASGIALSKLRAPIELINLSCFLVFLTAVKKEPTDWRHWSGLAASTVGTLTMVVPSCGAAPGPKAGHIAGAGGRKIAAAHRMFHAALNRASQQRQHLGIIERELRGLMEGHLDREHCAPATDQARKLLEIANGIERAMQDQGEEIEAAHASTRHWSRNSLKYLFLGIAAAVMAGSLTGALAVKDDRARAALYGVVAAGIKTVAWYGHTLIPPTLKPSHAISWQRPALKSAGAAFEDIVLGYVTAHFEYQSLVKANSLANLAEVRSGLAAADLCFAVGVLATVKGEPFGLRQGVALVLAGLGVALANLPIHASRERVSPGAGSH